MAKIVGFFKTLRNHWKKTTFGVLLITYGVDYAYEKHVTRQLIKSYCHESQQYGDMPLPIGTQTRQITVILNPAANGGKAKHEFEKYCAPILYLSGMKVSVVKTETIGEARGLMEVMDHTDGIVVAGGDGALSEVITGLLRRPDGETAAKRFPIGIIPVGKVNSVACSLFKECKDDRIKMMAEATMAVVRDVQRPLDLMKVQVVEETASGKPIYAAGQFRWGAFRDVEDRIPKYWLWGPLRSYAAYLFSPFRDYTWNCSSNLRYTLPCDGCNRCKSTNQTVTKPKQPTRWWQAFVPRPLPSPSDKPQKDYSSIVNPECGVWHQKDLSTVELEVVTENNIGYVGPSQPKHLQVTIGPEQVSSLEFIHEGWRRVGKKPTILHCERIAAQELTLEPVVEETSSQGAQPTEDSEKKKDSKEKWFSIDNDNYEVKPIQVTLLPEAIRVFAPAPHNT